MTVTPLLLTRTAYALRKEIVIVLTVLGFIFALPILALIALTDLGALTNPELKLYSGPVSTRNTYIFGFCTFWAAQRRDEVGKAIPNNWRNANDWDDGAIAAGYLVDQTPTVGAIMQSDSGKEGHVAFVEKVNPDGTWEISEMNVKGWNILSNRTLKPEQAANYQFIH